MRSDILFICKSDLNTDGRVLNQLRLLSDNFPNKRVDFLLLPDRKTTVPLPHNVKLKEVKCIIRNNKYLRLFTVMEWTVRALAFLHEKKPKILHVQDSGVVIPVWLFLLVRNKKTRVIYDDHEIPNENDGFGKRIINYFERRIIKHADLVISANQERLQYLKSSLPISGRSTYFLNMPHYDEDPIKLDIAHQRLLDCVSEEIKNGTKFILHQGPLLEQRGRRLLAQFCNQLPTGYKLLLIGGTKADYDEFVNENSLTKDTTLFLGKINYECLPVFWSYASLSVILYLPKYRNNKLCAPNRFYMSIYKGIPAIVNKDNPVLFNFTKKYKSGVFLEDIFLGEPLGEIPQKSRINKLRVTELIQSEQKRFIEHYRALFDKHLKE